jgi:hypothetical protein
MTDIFAVPVVLFFGLIVFFVAKHIRGLFIVAYVCLIAFGLFCQITNPSGHHVAPSLAKRVGIYTR